MQERKAILPRMRPEVSVGGFSRFDGTVEFYARINALIDPQGTVLDFGAGRGGSSEDACQYRRDMQSFRGRVAESIGADIDPAVVTNPKIDRHIFIRRDGLLELECDSVDVIICDWVFEHLEQPRPVLAELKRVLKPGGWLCARTPNKWGLTSVAARSIPGAFHQSALAWLQPRRRTQDVFPTYYKLNSPGALKEALPVNCWDLHVYGWNGDPAYHADSVFIWRATEMIFRLLPERFAATWHIFAQKKLK